MLLTIVVYTYIVIQTTSENKEKRDEKIEMKQHDAKIDEMHDLLKNVTAILASNFSH